MATNLGILAFTTRLTLSLSSAVISSELFPATQISTISCQRTVSMRASTLSTNSEHSHWLWNCVSVIITVIMTCQRSKLLGFLISGMSYWEWSARKFKAAREARSLLGWITSMLPNSRARTIAVVEAEKAQEKASKATRRQKRWRKRAELSDAESSEDEDADARRPQARRSSCQTGLLAGANLAHITRPEQPIRRRRPKATCNALEVPAQRAQEMYVLSRLRPLPGKRIRMGDDVSMHGINGRYLDLDLPVACPPTA